MTNTLITAEKLLEADAVRLSPKNPFIWASGWKSPIYCDNRKILSQPIARDYIKKELSDSILLRYPQTELIAGVATAGIAWGAIVSDELKLPFVYVRSKPKEHGMGNQIEGQFYSKQKVVVIEDLISTGKSSMQVVDVLRKADIEVIGLISIFNYEFETAGRAFHFAAIDVYSLTNYSSLLKLALQNGLINEKEEVILLKWREDPANWNGLS